MKTYRKPKAKIVNTKGHVILAGSGGLNNGDPVGNHTVGGGNENRFSKDCIWGFDEE